MSKLDRLNDGEWVRHLHLRTFEREPTTEPDRLRVGVPAGTSEPLRLLLPVMTEPVAMLYVLHTPRGGSHPGRYQSPGLAVGDLLGLLQQYEPFLAGDARHDIWVHSPATQATIVWDRHDVLYVYTLVETALSELSAAGYLGGKVSIPSPHVHNYHAHFDTQERSLLAELPWHRTDLREQDLQ